MTISVLKGKLYAYIAMHQRLELSTPLGKLSVSLVQVVIQELQLFLGNGSNSCSSDTLRVFVGAIVRILRTVVHMQITICNQ